MKKCPYCAEEVLDQTTVCNFCGRTIAEHKGTENEIIQGEDLPEHKNSEELNEKGKNKTIWIFLGILVIIVLFAILYTQTGFYTIQPIGALPEGITLLVWRSGQEPFFNSPDAMCLLIQDGVSLLCRMAALNNAPIDRVIVRLPYIEWAYLRSTGGLVFDR